MSEKKPLDVQAIRARCDAATQGPWEVSFGQNDNLPKYAYADTVTGDRVSLNTSEADATFIAASRADVIALCDEVELLRGERAKTVEWLRERARLSKLFTGYTWESAVEAIERGDHLK